MKTKESKTEVMKRERCDHDGDLAITTTFTASPLLLTRAELLLVNRVRDAGYKCKRSRVIQALLTIATDAAEMLDVEEIIDLDSLARELQRAICEKEVSRRK